MIKNWKDTAKQLEVETYTLYLAYKDPEVPLYLKILIFLVIAYLLSPIDLIPDFIPVLGYLDDFLLITIGLPILLKIIPKEILDEHRKSAELKLNKMQKNKYAAAIIILIWILAAILVLRVMVKLI